MDLLDEHFHPIAGFTSGVVTGGDGLDCPVTWRGRALTELGGKSVRAQVRLKRLADNLPRLYALNI